jgi:hypothetical protein
MYARTYSMSASDVLTEYGQISVCSSLSYLVTRISTRVILMGCLAIKCPMQTAFYYIIDGMSHASS